MKKNNVLEVINLTHSYKEKRKEKLVFKDLSFSVGKGEILSIIGKSGCGKSTMLKIIAGFLTPTSGKIIVNGEEHKKPTKNVMYLQQNYEQLFAWKNVLKNIAYSIEQLDLDEEEIKKRANYYTELVELNEYKEVFPNTLSGGQKQRVAFARALAIEPDLILMDEPFAALDASTRDKLQESTKRIIKEKQQTVLFVSHNIKEAQFMGDRILVFRKNEEGDFKYYFIENPQDKDKDEIKNLL